MDKPTLELWLEIYHNDLILNKILGMFHLKEQIMLRDVCRRFQYIIRDVIWKRKYQDLLIQRTSTTFALAWRQPAVGTVSKAVTEESKSICGKVNFDAADLYEFLEYHRRHLRHLAIKSIYMCKDFCTGVVFNYRGEFENLQVLEYHDVMLNDENIRTIRECCPNLRQLHLCKIENHLTAKYVDELKSLHTFSIEECYVTWSYENFFNIFKLPLKKVKIFHVSFEKKLNSDFVAQTDNLVDTLEVLKLENVASRFDYAFDILRCTSRPLYKLKELQIMCSSNLKSHHFELIAEKCPQLQKLSITRSWFEVDTLKFPFHLKELYVDNCVILSPENAWHILTQLDLKVLEISKIESKKFYTFNYTFDVGATLKTLKLQPFLSNDCDKEFWLDIFENCSLNSFNQVDTLHCDGLYATDSHMELIAKKLPKIQHLFIEDSELSGKYIYRIPDLKSLSFKYCMCIDFWYFIKILQISQYLQSLAIAYTEFENVDPDDDDDDIPCIGNCSLTRLHIDYDIFSICLPFWLNLLRLNLTNIEILSRCENFSNKFESAFLQEIFEDATICRNLKGITVKGFFNETSLKHRKGFVELLYNSTLRKHLRRVCVSDCQIDTSVDSSECMDRITWCLTNYQSYDFTIEFK